MIVTIWKQLRQAANTEWHPTNKLDMVKLDLSPILRISGEPSIVSEAFSCHLART